MTFTAKTLIAASIGTAALVSAIPAYAAHYGGPKIMGGVNLDAYCKRYHGQSSRAVVVEQQATGWRCKNSNGAVFGISVQRACVDTYGMPIKAIVIGEGLPGDWRCARSRRHQ